MTGRSASRFLTFAAYCRSCLIQQSSVARHFLTAAEGVQNDAACRGPLLRNRMFLYHKPHQSTSLHPSITSHQCRSLVHQPCLPHSIAQNGLSPQLISSTGIRQSSSTQSQQSARDEQPTPLDEFQIRKVLAKEEEEEAKRHEKPHVEKPKPPSHDAIYYGPLSDTHKLLKRVSIANTAVALAAAPYIMMSAEMSYASRVALAGSLVFFGLLTTGALHWVTHPYVHELRYRGATQLIEARTTSLLGQPKWHKFQLKDVHPLPWDRPVATFMANGQFFYIDVYSFPDEDLLRCLTPGEVPEGYKKDQDDEDDD